MNEHESRLVVVTVVKDDVLGLDRTCTSIAEQTAPVSHLIMNGGTGPDIIDATHRWSQELGSAVVHQADTGPYDAMNLALNQLQPRDRVWFLNSGDVFAEPDAYAYVDDLTCGPDFTWGFGPVRVMEPNGQLRHIPRQACYTPRNHAYGRTPICHQASVCRVRDLRAIGGFDEHYPIVADYRAFLLLAQISAPVQWTKATVEYRAGGISDHLLLRGHWQEHQARREILGGGPIESARSLGYVAKMAARITTGRAIDVLADRGLVASDWRSRRGART